MTRRALAAGWGAVEVALMAALFVITLWVVGPQVPHSPVALAIYWTVLAIWAAMILWLSPMVLHRDPPSLRGWGLGRSKDDPGTVRNAWPAYAICTGLSGLALIVAAAVRDPGLVSHIDWRALAHKLVIYEIWAPIQALTFFGYLQTRVRTVLEAAAPSSASAAVRRPLVALIVAGLFALAHAPNWPLASLVFAAGLGWSWLFYARPSVLLVGASHGVLGTIVYGVLHLFTRVGPFYAHPEIHLVRSAIPGLKALVGNLF